MTDFDSLEAIDRHYKKQLAEADEAALPQVQFEVERAKFNFEKANFVKASAALTREQTLREIQHKFPQIDEELIGYVQGTTKEEMEASAQKLAARFQGQDPAYAAYGPPTGTNGTVPIGSRANDDKTTRVRTIDNEIQQGMRLKERDARQFVKDVGNHAMNQAVRAAQKGEGR